MVASKPMHSDEAGTYITATRGGIVHHKLCAHTRRVFMRPRYVRKEPLELLRRLSTHSLTSAKWRGLADCLKQYLITQL